MALRLVTVAQGKIESALEYQTSPEIALAVKRLSLFIDGEQEFISNQVKYPS